VPTPADYDKKITVTVTGGTANFAWSTPSTSSATKAVVHATITKHSLVISGHRNVGQTISVSTATWGPAPVDMTYQWYRSGKAISGATAASYPLVSADRGKKIDVKVIGRKAGYTATSVTTKTSIVTRYPLLAATPTPTISGSETVGQKLTATAGDWETVPVSLSYQWKVGGKAIAHATHSTFVIPMTYSGKIITVTVTGKKTHFATAAETSDPTSAIEALTFTSTPTPTISGAFGTGKTIKVVTGTWVPKPTFLYRWLRDGVPISGATKSSYKLVSKDAGKDIEVKVEGKKTGYHTVTVQSGIEG
jgi:hypothetical protein